MLSGKPGMPSTLLLPAANLCCPQDEVPADPNKIHLPKFVGHT